VLLAGIWSGVLGRASIGRHESFFDLGGDSLSAMVVAAQVHAALTVQLDLRAFADHPTLAPLAAAIDKLRQTGQVDGRPGLVRVSRQTPMPLSFAQERTWKYSRTPEASAGYTVACSHRIRGPLNIEMLRECMSYIERRHEILRTTFDTIDGKPVQIVHPSEPVSVPLIDLTGVPDAEAQAGLLLREEGRRPFDLARRPLVRFTLVRIRPDEHRLLRANHHINSDGWSWSVYFRELAMLYEAKLRGEPPPLPEFELLQYGDYAAWQRSTLHPDGPAYRGAVEWWRKLFSDMPRPVNLPFLRRKPLEYADPVDGLIFRGLDPTISRRLDEVGREEGATFFGVRLAALVALLADESRQPDVILGIYVTNRNRVASQNMFGFFANLATLRLNCDFSRSFCQWVALVQRMVVEIQARAEIPYEQLSEELRQGGVNPPEIRAIFGVSDHATVHFGGLELTWLERRMESMPWGFSVAFDQNEDHRFRAVFDARIYDPDHVRAFLDRFAGFLDAASSHADRALAELLTISRTARA
jgi:acyl carrier protein